MALAGILILAVFIASALLLVLVVLIQDDQGQGIGGMFGGGEGSSPFGSRTGNVLTKFTSILGAVFLVAAFALAWINRTPDRDDFLERARLQSLDVEEGRWWVRPAAEDDGAAPEDGGAPPAGGTDAAAPAGATPESGSAESGSAESGGTVGQVEAAGSAGGNGSGP